MPWPEVIPGAVMAGSFHLMGPLDGSGGHVYEARHDRLAGRFVVKLFPGADPATFQLRAHRDAARDVARRAAAPILFVECVCPPDEVRRRLRERGRRGDDASDADWAIYQQQRRRYEAFASDEADHVVVDTSQPPEVQIARIESAVRAL